VLAITVATAAAQPAPPAPKRKATPDKFTRAAGEAFTQALEADKKGDLAAALGLYTKAFEISPHPNSVFNMADVQLRLGKLTDALKSYETYLVLAPNASDRKDVEALIDKIAKTTGVLTLKTSAASDPKSMSFKEAYVLLDGVIVKKPGVAPIPGEQPSLNFDALPGKHIVDVITPVSFGTTRCEAKPGARTDCFVVAPPRTDGAVVASSPDPGLQLLVEPEDRDDLIGKRFVRPAGKGRLLLRDRNYECLPVALDVPTGGDVAYVYLRAGEYDRLQRCRTIDVKKQRLQFEP
jgi:tetratricopeptide (TPR) repeat protein